MSDEEREFRDAVLSRLDTIIVALTARSQAQPAGSGSTQSSPGGACFPNYGRSKGQPIHGAAMQELDYYAAGARKSIADPAKARWREKESSLLAAIEQEIARQSGGGQGPARGSAEAPDFGPPPDDDAPFLRCDR